MRLIIAEKHSVARAIAQAIGGGTEQDGHILLTVRDDGIGIEEKDLPRIFDRFYRADRARDRSGSGLGLSIVKWIVELHGWSIQAASKPGQGTVFTIQT